MRAALSLLMGMPLLLVAGCDGPPTCSGIHPQVEVVHPGSYAPAAAPDGGASGYELVLSADRTTVEETFTTDGGTWRITYRVKQAERVSEAEFARRR